MKALQMTYPREAASDDRLVVRNKSFQYIFPRQTGAIRSIENLTHSGLLGDFRSSNPVPFHARKMRENFCYGLLGRLQHILQQTKAPLKDASAVNSTKEALCATLRETGLPLETSTGGRTKWNRSRFGIPKTHALDAVCVGTVESVSCWQKPTLVIKATGRGCYQRTRLTANGFPRGYLTRTKQIHGFQTGDIARAVVPTGKKAGTHVGRIAVRATGSFNIQTPYGVVQGISHRHCLLVQRGDGYSYQSPLQSVQCIA